MKETIKVWFVALCLTTAAVTFFYYAFENQNVIYQERVAVKGF